MLSRRHLTTLFAGLEQFKASETHISFEANPATFDLKKAQLFEELAIDRISLGIQSFTQQTLTTLGREHSPVEAERSVELLRAVDFPEINVDLMFSIPGQSSEQWQHDLDTVVRLRPHHVSAYNLTYEEDTTFFKKLLNGSYSENEDLNADLFAAARSTLTAAGYSHYETSNYALGGYESRHNRGYWEGRDYLGIGPSAVSTLGRTRWQNWPDTSRYIKQVQTLGHALYESEALSEDDLRTERIALMLRTSAGVDRSLLKGSPPRAVSDLCEAGYAILTESHLVLTNTGRPLVDEIAVSLL